jgi:hypothetical protein
MNKQTQRKKYKCEIVYQTEMCNVHRCNLLFDLLQNKTTTFYLLDANTFSYECSQVE